MKEHEMQEYAAQLNELKSMMVPSTGALRSTLLDPAVNILIQKMKKELEDTKKKLEDTQNDLNAWKFTPDRYVCMSLSVRSGILFCLCPSGFTMSAQCIFYFTATLASDLWQSAVCYIKRTKSWGK